MDHKPLKLWADQTASPPLDGRVEDIPTAVMIDNIAGTEWE